MLINNCKSSTISILYDSFSQAGVRCRSGVGFCDITTIRCGGGISLYVCPTTNLQLVMVLQRLIKDKIPYLVLGMGSKVLGADDGYCGVVVTTRYIQQINCLNNKVVCDSGTHTVLVARYLQQHALSGGEYLFCLPATMGGATYMNAGCYKQTTADIVSNVTCLDGTTGKMVVFDNQQCCFGKRHSIFVNNNLIILQVELKLTCADKGDIMTKMTTMLSNKRQQQPLNQCSCGSVFFTSQSELPAALMIDQAGLKGLSVGGASVSTKHAGFVVNCGNAQSSHVVQLIEQIEQIIQERYNIALNREIIVL